MVDADANRLLTESGAATPGGWVLRQYWQPAALSEELHGDRPVVPVTMLNEALVLFRDDDGRLGLVGRRCPHRGVDLAFGRPEDGGLRCPFHGWLFGVDGTCLETPAEPVSSTFRTRIRHTSYPVREVNGIVWAYLGDGDPPPLPALDCFVAPESHVFAFKGRWDANWLQAHEVGIDPAHAAFLHRFLDDDTEEYGLQFRDRVADTGMTMTRLMREASAPSIVTESTSFGFRMRTARHLPGELTHVRTSNCIFPNAIAVSMSREMAITQWHVPIDDTSCYWYSMFVSFGRPVERETMRSQRLAQVVLPDYRPVTNRANNWGFDPDEQRRSTYTGMGRDINVHDQWAVESQGTVYDRTTEHLAPTDVGIRTHRRMFLAAATEPPPHHLVGRPAPGGTPVRAGPVAVDAVTAVDAVAVDADGGIDGNNGGVGGGVAADAALDAAWRRQDAARRAACPWPAGGVGE
ncbi:MAG: Rieske 2Fe-2S domain-containing protein [Acidimicrobiales bacterium]